MVPISQETSVDVLRQYTLWLEEEVKRLSKELCQFRNEEDRARQQTLNTELQDQLTRLRKKFFGFGRETAAPEVGPRPVGHLNQELLPHGARPVSSTETALPELARQGFDHGYSEEALRDAAKARGILPASASVWERMPGFTQDSSEITIVERTYVKREHRRMKYRLKDEYNTTGKEVIITAPGPVKLKPQSHYSVDFAVAVVSDKYEFHLPLERQRRKMEGAGLAVDVKTLFSLSDGRRALRKGRAKANPRGHLGRLLCGTSGRIALAASRRQFGLYVGDEQSKWELHPFRALALRENRLRDAGELQGCDTYGRVLGLQTGEGAFGRPCRALLESRPPGVFRANGGLPERVHRDPGHDR